MPAREEMPDTIKRSSAKAQRTWAATHDSAVETYGEGERAHRTAYSALKHSFEKVGARWVANKSKGPSDPQAAKGGRAARDSGSESFGGVDVMGHTKSQLYDRARKLDISGRSSMTKTELARAIARKQ